MIHQYKNNGYNIVLDVNSGSVHVVDDIVYDIIALYENSSVDEIADKLKDKYKEEDIREACQEIEELKEEGQLFTEDIYEPYIDSFKDRPTVVKALCLHIAHDCNLACRYCFAEEGEYHGRRALMSFEVGKKALDFLVANSGSRRNLEVDFFGGEPTMNFEVVKQLIIIGIFKRYLCRYCTTAIICIRRYKWKSSNRKQHLSEWIYGSRCGSYIKRRTG
mgnify:CR=1 FL=1